MRCHRRTSERPGQRAFTLLELLVATAVGAVVLIVVQTTFFTALRLHTTTRDRVEEERVIERTLAIVRRDLAGLMLPGGVLSGELITDSFSSTATDTPGDRVSPDFYTNSGRIDGWTPFSDVQRVAYFLAASTSGQPGADLVRAVSRNLLPVQEGESDNVVLLQGVAAVEVLFFDGTGWTEVWDSSATSTLPSALKFSLVMASRSGAQQNPAPIELIVPVLATTTTSQTQAEEEAAL